MTPLMQTEEADTFAEYFAKQPTGIVVLGFSVLMRVAIEQLDLMGFGQYTAMSGQPGICCPAVGVLSYISGSRPDQMR